MLVDTAGSKRELRSVMKEPDDALQDVLEVNLKYGMTLEDDDDKKKCEEYSKEVSEEHKVALERVEAHLKARAGESPSEATGASAASREAAQHSTRLAEVENEVRKLELQQLQQRLKKEEEEEKLRRDRLLQEKQDALKAASLKAELTKTAESELVWDRRQDFTGNRSSDDVGEVQESCTKKTPEDCIKKTQENCTKKTKPLSVSCPETASLVFQRSLPRLKLPTFTGVVED